jgi:hypothetical protein
VISERGPRHAGLATVCSWPATSSFGRRDQPTPEPSRRSASPPADGATAISLRRRTWPLSVEGSTADFADGLARLGPYSAVFVAELGGRIVGYAYVLPSPDADTPAETSELGSLYVTEDARGPGWLRP